MRFIARLRHQPFSIILRWVRVHVCSTRWICIPILDLQDAYNLVSLPKLASNLLRLNTSPWLVRWIMSALKSRRCSLKCGNWMSNWSSISTALPQGSPLSPVCFNAYTYELAAIPAPDNARVMSFADDITIVAWHNDPDVMTRTAQEMVEKVRRVCEGLDMRINPRKASATIFANRRPLPTTSPVVYGDEPIPYAPSIKLLGITLDPGLTFSEHTTAVRSRCLQAMSTLKAAFSRGVDLRRLTHLYRALILPRITYGLEIIPPNVTTMEKLDRIQNSALRLISGCSRHTHLTSLRFMFDLPSICDIHEQMRAKAICRIAADTGHPLHNTVDQMLTVPPRARLERTGWIRGGVKQVRNICGRHTIRREPEWKETPVSTQSKWSFHIDRFGRSDRELPPSLVDALFEDFLSEIQSQQDDPTVILATDGSVKATEPRSGWGCTSRDSAGELHVRSGGCKLLLSSMRAEREAVNQGLDLVRITYPDVSSIAICTDSQSLLRKLETGVSPPEWQDAEERIVWIYCPGHAGVQLNERADHLAGSAPTSDRIRLGASDIIGIIKDAQLRRCSGEEECPGKKRMLERGIRRGWVAKSHDSGRASQVKCQLATGTISRAALIRVLQLGGAEAAWSRLFGSRFSL